MGTRSGDAAISGQAVGERLVALRDRIDAASAGRDIKVLAVTKAFGVEAVLAANDAGLFEVGENYASELVHKASDDRVAPTTKWHFIGRLQSNKVKDLAPYVDVWQSVDRLKVAKLIARLAPGADVYAQMRPAGLGDEAEKGGCPPGEIPALVDAMRALGLNVSGIMTVGVAGDQGLSAAAFTDAVDLADRLGLPQRSMGMTDDLELAVAAGSTMVRVGSALFGPRPPRTEERAAQ